jgi:NADPH:quinone reductase-like Zn-dependent oxidoreductase
VAGVVEQTGPGPFSPGEEVYAHLDWSSGGYADFALCALKGLAKKPSSLSMVQAAGVPLAATTAYQGLFEHGALKAGQRVLIHGASGGVGAYAVQFAHQAGAVVFATASAEGCQAVESYGADVTIDYRHQRFEDVATDIDLVLDLVGGETQQRSFAVVKTGGALISAVTPPDAALAAERGIRIERYMAHPDADQLRLFASLIDEGRLKTTLAKTFPLEEASAAHRCLEAAHPRGKVVLRLSS